MVSKYSIFGRPYLYADLSESPSAASIIHRKLVTKLDSALWFKRLLQKWKTQPDLALLGQIPFTSEVGTLWKTRSDLALLGHIPITSKVGTLLKTQPDLVLLGQIPFLFG